MVEIVTTVAKRFRDACANADVSLQDLQRRVQAWQEDPGLDPLEYVNIGNANGKVALHFAAQHRDDDIAAWLIELKADVNTTTCRGQTALIFAGGRGHGQTVLLLLAAKARCRVRAAAGGTARSEATGLSEDCMEALREAEELETEDWLDFTLDERAVKSQARHLHFNPNLLRSGGALPASVAEALETTRRTNLHCSHQRAAALQGVEGIPKELPKQFQAEKLLSYDAIAFPFAGSLRGILQEDCELSMLHHTDDGQRILEKFANSHGISQLGPRDNIWNQRFLSTFQSKDHVHVKRFNDLLHEFIRTCVLPDLGTDRIAFQVKPTLRCHLPATGASGRPHRDENYGHPWSEINYWIPVTKVWGSNSLTAESSCGLGDFHSFDADIGQGLRFWGNQVWHFTCPNETDSTRVSFDIRVIREEEWSPTSFEYFRLGEYYAVMDVNGLVKADALAKLCEQYNGAGSAVAKKPYTGLCAVKQS